MKQILFLALFALLFLWSCETSNEEKTRVPKEKFMKVYTEIMTLESYYKMHYKAPNIYKDSLLKSVDKVLQKNSISFDDFESTYSYYSRNQELFQELNTELIELYSK